MLFGGAQRNAFSFLDNSASIRTVALIIFISGLLAFVVAMGASVWYFRKQYITMKGKYGLLMPLDDDKGYTNSLLSDIDS
jgi:hypothetical protein